MKSPGTGNASGESPNVENASTKNHEPQGQKKHGVRDGFVFEEPEEIENAAYAGFWTRLAAFLIDSVLVWVGLLLVRLVMLFVSSGLNGTVLDGNILFHYSLTDIVVYLAEVVYFILFTYYSGATLGKRVLNLRVVNADGGKLSLWDVVYRETIGRFLCAVTIGIGYIFVAADKEKRGLHDMLCDTRVIYAKTMKIYPVYYTTAGRRVPGGGIAPNRGAANYGGFAPGRGSVPYGNPAPGNGPVNYGGPVPGRGAVNYGGPVPGRETAPYGNSAPGRGAVNSGGYTASARPGNYNSFEERRGAFFYGNDVRGKENAAYGSTLQGKGNNFYGGVAPNVGNTSNMGNTPNVGSTPNVGNTPNAWNTSNMGYVPREVRYEEAAGAKEPTWSNQPGQSGQPDQPNWTRPGQPNWTQPGQSGQPGQPNWTQPGQSGQPNWTQPGQPGQPDWTQPGQPGQPNWTQPGQSGQPGQLTRPDQDLGSGTPW